jgi:mono/diheme cytochrome c family protein
MRTCALAALALIGGLGATPDAARADPPIVGATVFANHCAVCHGPDAAGIPGSFPPLHEQVVGFAKSPAGREYLIMVVTTGLAGDLPVGGITYRGVMPAQTTLSEAELAAALNYLAAGLDKLKPVRPAFTAKEVIDVRARHADKSPQNTRALRPGTPTP